MSNAQKQICSVTSREYFNYRAILLIRLRRVV